MNRRGFLARCLGLAVLPLLPKVALPAPGWWDTIARGVEIDWSTANVFQKTIRSDTAFSFANDRDGSQIMVMVANNGNAVTWPDVQWSHGRAAPAQTPRGRDVYTFTKVGPKIFGSVVQCVG